MLVRDHSGEVKEFDFSALGLAANIPLSNLGSVTDIDMALPAAYLKNLSEPGSTTYNFINMQQSKSLVVYLLFTYTGPDGYAHNLFFPEAKWAHGATAASWWEKIKCALCGCSPLAQTWWWPKDMCLMHNSIKYNSLQAVK